MQILALDFTGLGMWKSVEVLVILINAIILRNINMRVSKINDILLQEIIGL